MSKNTTDTLFDPQEVQIALATATTSLVSLTVGEYVVVVNSEFDVTVRGEPYLALMYLLNVRSGKFMAREEFSTIYSVLHLAVAPLISQCAFRICNFTFICVIEVYFKFYLNLHLNH